MVEYVSLNINSHQTTLIHKKAFIDMVNGIDKSIDDIQIIHPKTTILIKGNKSVSILLEVKFKPNVSISQKFKEIKNKIESHSIYLIDQKPSNIIINYLGSIEEK